ncbi:putative EamA domain-containing protein [Helianthus annuus]|uniref:WAT1-related protein n=1 Tax=Helianthus annuus TaxID=4232 RepID=A0A251S7P0_HELAN|nr:WAT1-related protein At5g40230 [Helianthus annuus]KAF5764294.1 putative EamA domain-containing protein [Helianthus annuus]KAJ0450993.1 putative EamA domain-containing protein [Helianthus annuus]KAJ0455358.1 putative EamA domain-containing protein [Helianthus annuus]KAJ0472853.1 putative EamA domain-containing protein [Helianthus annuus]KAJ0648458.1 putative EamA domain-containing protein [Helianthus annuus]
MKEYAGMVAAQTAQVLLMIVSKSAIAAGMSNYSFIFYSNLLASLVLLPLSLIFHRSVNRPAISTIVVCGFFLIGMLGFLAQVTGYTGISYSSATLATTLLNLIPGFTFILAIICRMETFQLGSSATRAKFIGTVVSVAGAIMVTLYKGPAILSSPLKSEIVKNLSGQPSNWVLGGIFLAIDAAFSSAYIIAQAFVLKKYPAEMIVMFAYCFVCTILSGLTSLIVEDDLSSYSLQPKKRLFSILYSGIFGSAFQVTVQAWCVRRKGPFFVAMFHPVGIVISTLIGVIFLGDGFYLGSLMGSIVVVIGFYSVMWGKAKDEKIVAVLKTEDEQAPLVQDVEEQMTLSSS